MIAKLYIPSTGRANRQVTLRSLPLNWVKKTTIVVPKGDFEEYKKTAPVKVIVQPTIGVGMARHFICEQAEEDYAVMVDDDVVFYTRRKGKLFNSTPEEVGEALDMLVRWLDEEEDVAQAGLSLSMFNCRKTDDFYYNERCCTVFALRLSAYRRIKHGFDALPRLQEDNAMTLGLLTSGYKVKLSYAYAFKNVPPLPEHRHTGCSGYRTPERELESCLKLKKLYDKYVTVHYSDGNGKSKYSLYNRPAKPIIRWKKAYEDSIKH